MCGLNPGLGGDDAPKDIFKGYVLSCLKGFLQVAGTNTAKLRRAKMRMARGRIQPFTHAALRARREDWP